MRDLRESRGAEHAAGADVELVRRDLQAGFREHRVRLERPRAAFPREADGCPRERVADAAPTESRPGVDARDRPHALVGLVLRSPFPGNAVVAHEALVRRARLDGAPSDRLALGVRDEPARRPRLRVRARTATARGAAWRVRPQGTCETPRAAAA